MLFPDWKSFFAARTDNKTGNKNTSVFTEAWSPETNGEQRFQMLTSDPNMVIFAAGKNKSCSPFTASRMQEAHSFAQKTS
jgi:hypothetical protein